ncbi:hypothetical protein HDU79_005309 [Rhizoclosmatium sp. JEL0117]|nr:hypothetical protein HDU79_005309 [Rhizoclosmatium sp. JEL0117]
MKRVSAKPLFLGIICITAAYFTVIYSIESQWIESLTVSVSSTSLNHPVKVSLATSNSSLTQTPHQSLNNTKIPIFNTTEMVSQVLVTAHDSFKYAVCEYQNVCITSNQTTIYTKTRKVAAFLTRKYKNCKLGNDAFCRCHKRSGVHFTEFPKQSTTVSFETTPTWLMYQWSNRHHVAHFAFSMVQFHSILLHREFYSLPNFTTLLFQDNPPPLLPYDQKLLDIVKSTGTLEYLDTVEFLDGGKERCFQSVHTSRISEVYATSQWDLEAFRKSAEHLLRLNLTLPGCPPPKALILIRQSTQKGRERRIMNIDALDRYLKRKGFQQVDIRELNGKQSLEEQAGLVSQYGLIISSHSSQLANLLFARHGAVVIETSVVYKPAFRTLGEMAGLKYINSVGHRPDKRERAYAHKLYDKVRTCLGDQRGFLAIKNCALDVKEREVLKSVNYWIDFEGFGRDLEEGLEWIRGNCTDPIK